MKPSALHVVHRQKYIDLEQERGTLRWSADDGGNFLEVGGQMS
jgi:hypothetical protein